MSCRYLNETSQHWMGKPIYKAVKEAEQAIFFDAKYLHTPEKRAWANALTTAASSASKPTKLVACFDSATEASRPLFVGKYGKAASISKRQWLAKNGISSCTSSKEFKGLCQ